MKKTYCFLLIICMALALTACGRGDIPEDVPSDMLYVENEILRVGVCYPIGWSVAENDGFVSLIMDTNSAPTVSTYASVTVMRRSMVQEKDFSEFWKNHSDRLDKELNEYKLVKEEETKLAGVKAGQYHYTAKVDGEVYNFVQAIFVNDGRNEAYLVTFTASETDYEMMRPDFDKIVANFRFN